MKTKRLFVAIELPESTRRFLVDLDPKIHGARWLDAGQMHLTLGFFGDVPEDVDLRFREKLSVIEFGAFFLPIVCVGAFPAKGWPKVLRCNCRRAGTRFASLASSHHACALPKCFAAIAWRFFKIEC